jgi:putative spermidine/putrescine transport system permease protein
MMTSEAATPITPPRRRIVVRRVDDLAQFLASTTIVVGLAFLVVPVVVALAMSLDARDYLGQFPPTGLSLKWYARFFSEPYYRHGLATSLILASLCAVISTALGVATAVGIDRTPPQWRDRLTALFLMPLIVPGVVIGFALLMFYARIGIDNAFLRLLGGHVLITFPSAIRTVLAALAGIRPSLTEAALSLGATERCAFWSVTFPLVRTGIAAGAVFAFAFSLDDVAVSMFLSDPTSYTLPVALVSMMYSNFDLTIAAAAMLFVLVTAALMVLLDWAVGLDRVVGTGLYRT